MQANDIKEGMDLKLTHGRVGKMRDNKMGIARVVEVEVPGQGVDVGSTYVDEILWVKETPTSEWKEVVLSETHLKKIKNVRVMW